MKIPRRCGAGRQACRAESHLGFSVLNTFVNFLLVSTVLCTAAFAQNDRDASIAAILSDLSATNTFPEVAMSPDGKRAAWVGETIENGKDTGNSAIYVKDLASSAAPIRITAGAGGKTAHSERNLAWSPDSKQIAFFSDSEKKKQMQLYIAPAAGGRARKLTSLKGFMTDPQWSPDSSHIAILFAENAPGGGGPLEAEPEETGVIGGEIFNQRLTVIDVTSPAAKQVSPKDMHIYEYDWSPDGKTFAASAAPGPGDNNWWIAQLYTIPLDTGKLTSIYKPETQIAMPRWSTDGASIGFIQGLMSDAGFTGGEVYTIAAAGGNAVDRTPGRRSSISSIQWLSPEKMLFTEVAGGSSVISTFDVSSGAAERLFKGDENLAAGGNIANFSAARDGKAAAAVRADFHHPPEVWAGAIGDWKQLTQSNAAHKPQWGEVRNMEWSSDGAAVQGWLLYPRDFDASKRYPMIVSIHGGPANWNSQHWPTASFDQALLSALGYFVFYPNPRGSYGQGETFTRANVKDFGYGDLRDIMAGVDAVLKAAPVDPNRLGVAGWSYGGYMTMWTVTQTNRFKAAVAGAGISDWLSYYGENAIDQWMIPYFGASVYDDPAVYAKSSPITFIKNVKTPTLIVVGERDGECPAPQSYEFWHALNTLGVPNQFVVYPREGHRFRESEHKRDVMERAAKWFEDHLK
jgi:dipeptidyl aminopeptidase/acylaminoacyl peptidase